MNRILTFHEKEIVGDNTRIGAAYYLESDFVPFAVRLQVEKASVEGELKVDIFDDGVSIFEDHAYYYERASTSKGATVIREPEDTTIALSEGQTEEELAATSFNEIESGSWVTCKVIALNGAKNVTVQLELEPVE